MSVWQATLHAIGLGEHPDKIPTRRSPKWPALRKQWLQQHPACEVCGTRDKVVPHHIVPFHVDPERELDPSNLMSLCESAGVSCHLLVGHLNTFRSWNASAREDAMVWRAKILDRP